MKRKLLIGILTLLICISGIMSFTACNICRLEFALSDDGESYSVVETNGNPTYVKIPATYKGKPVTSIGYYAFKACMSLESVTIPDSVTVIGHGAFYKCTSLESVSIGNGVTEIESSAFGGCRSLKSVAIPNSVTYIREAAFRECYQLANVTIPDSVTFIGKQAFRYCSFITSITIPYKVTYIGSEAFERCNLESVTFENTDGWWYAWSDLATRGESILNTDIADPATAAKYLTYNYHNYNWHRG